MRRSALILLTFALNGCVGTGELFTFKSSPSDDPRYSYAVKLEQNKQLADALVQWRILDLLYPEDEQINKQISRLSDLISLQVSRLEQQISQLNKTASNNEQRQYLQLKILALKPDYQQVFADLQVANSKHELAKAQQKAQQVTKVSKKRKTKSDKDDDILNDMLAIAEQQKTHGDFEQLLESTKAIANISPQHPSLKHYRYMAWYGLAQYQLSQNQIETALKCYEKAIDFADITDKKRLTQNIKQLRQQESERLYTEAMKIFTSDIKQSINLLKQAMTINGDNQRARQQLSRAETIYKNLNLITKKPDSAH